MVLTQRRRVERACAILSGLERGLLFRIRELHSMSEHWRRERNKVGARGATFSKTPMGVLCGCMRAPWCDQCDKTDCATWERYAALNKMHESYQIAAARLEGPWSVTRTHTTSLGNFDKYLAACRKRKKKARSRVRLAQVLKGDEYIALCEAIEFCGEAITWF